MGLFNIYEIISLIKKQFTKILAMSIAVGIVTFLVASRIETYTCVLSFKYNHKGAENGLAPDGESKLDPYEIQNPVVIQGAIDALGGNTKANLDARGIRQNVSIYKVVTELDSEVTESAALNGEKYEAPITEYEMSFKYKSALGENFGAKMFNAIISEYDEYLLEKYYNKDTITDFAKIVKDSKAEYIDIATIMSDQIDEDVEYLNSMAENYPDFRSKTTGYSFAELAGLYTNIRDIQYAKFYGNIRAANLAKDSEMVIKSYQTKVKEQEEIVRVSSSIALNYKDSISSFYNSYKDAGLYRQAENIQASTEASNNRDKAIIYDADLEDHRNTYDEVVMNYVDYATRETDAIHTINYYNNIINSYTNDNIDIYTKDRLISENKKIFEEISVLSGEYSEIANESIDELYNSIVTSDLQYLIAPEVTSDIPVKLLTVFMMIFAFGFILLVVIFTNIAKKFVKNHEIKAMAEEEETVSNEKKVIDVANLDDLHQLIYEQYQNGFDEFYLVYQEMVSSKETDEIHMETFLRWKNEKLGAVAPGKIIDCISELDLFDELNEWIIKKACKDVTLIKEKYKKVPVIHINCPHSELRSFAIYGIILKCLKETKTPARCLCLELNGGEISASLEEIMLVKKMGVGVCIDRFENSEENDEIISVIKPEYVKMSLDILNFDMYATTKKDFLNAAFSMVKYLSDVIKKCHANNIKVCICGIEDKEQENTISLLDFDFKQGYYYNKPKTLEEE